MGMLNSGLNSNNNLRTRESAVRRQKNKVCLLLCLPLQRLLLVYSVFCILSAAHAHAGEFALQPSVVTGQAVKKIEVSGLYSMAEAELLDLLDIHTGRTVDSVDINAGIRRAFLKGTFEDIIVEGFDNGTAIRVTIKEKKTVGPVSVQGNEYFSDRFIKKRLNIYKGERLNVLALKNGLKHLQDELVRRGFIQAEVTYSLVPKKEDLVEIAVTVSEGLPEIITKITVSEHEDIVRSYLKLSEGDILDHTKMEQLIKDVTQYYRKQGHLQTALTYSFRSGTLNIEFNTGKKLVLAFEGNESIQSGVLIKEAPFFEINEFSDELAEETTARIIALYHKYGYPFAQAAPVISMSGDQMSLKFFIFEGDRYSIGSVTFENVTISQEKLRGVLVSRAGQYYDPDVIEADTDTISEFYRALGYLYMEIQEPDIKMTGDRVDIIFSIKEGPRVMLSAVPVKCMAQTPSVPKTEAGTDAYMECRVPEKDIYGAISIKEGDPYNEVDISEAKRRVLELYGKRGFLDAALFTDSEISGTAASVRFRIVEGQTTYFGKTLIIGNRQTRQRVIERELLHREGSPVDNSLFLAERQRLYRLGLFSDIETGLAERYPAPAAEKGSEGITRDVIYRVKEANAGAVEFGLGYGEYERARGFFDIGYKNLFGMNRQVSFRTELSTLEQRYILSYYEPWFTARDLIFKALVLYENKEEVNIDTREIRYRLRRNSVSAGVEKKISDRLKLEVYYDFSVVKTSDVMPDIVLSKEDLGAIIISGLRPGLIYDTRDNPFEPTKGLLVGMSFKVASSVMFSQTDFTKLTVYVNKYQGITRGLVFAASLRAGLANGFGGTRELPIVERFFLGGRTTVRGYEQDTLGPKGRDGTPTGGNAFAMANLELRANIGRGWGLVAFTDAGNVWRKADSIEAAHLKYTTGLGLRYNTPVGPFRVDYGYKLNREQDESKAELHFSLGHAF